MLIDTIYIYLEIFNLTLLFTYLHSHNLSLKNGVKLFLGIFFICTELFAFTLGYILELALYCCYYVSLIFWHVVNY